MTNNYVFLDNFMTTTNTSSTGDQRLYVVKTDTKTSTTHPVSEYISERGTDYREELKRLMKLLDEKQKIKKSDEENIAEKGYMKTDDHLRIMNQRIKEHEEKEKKYQNDIRVLQDDIAYLKERITNASCF